MCNGLFASKLTENAVILRYNFSLSDCHFSLIFLEEEVTSPYCQGPAWALVNEEKMFNDKMFASFSELTLNPPEGIIAGPVNEENFFEWEALIM